MPIEKKYLSLQVGLTAEDRKALDRLAKAEGKKKSEVARDAVRWYLKAYEKLKAEEHDNESAKAIKAMSNRMAAMLYRIGVAAQTLSEFQWMMLNDEGKDLFEECVGIAKQKLRNKYVSDERQVVEGMAEDISP